MSYDQADFARDFNVSRETLARFEIYHTLLLKWQRKINLVAPSTVDTAWQRHFADSAQLAAYLSPIDRITDLGSGAGFPGLVLAMMGFNVTLIESDQRKSLFLKEVARQTETECGILNMRIENAEVAADVVTARALTGLPELLSYAGRFIEPSGKCLFLKGKTAESEITQARENWQFELSGHQSLTDPDARILELFHVKQKN